MEPDISIFVNYGMAGLILLVFYLLWRNELSQLREAIESLKATQEKMITLLDVLLKRLMGEKE